MARSTENKKSTPSVSASKKGKDMEMAVRQYIAQAGNHTFNYRQVAHAIGLDTAAQQKSVAMLLASLAFDGDIIEVSPGKYKSPQQSNVVYATMIRRSNGKNSIITDIEGESVFVAERNSMHALNGDRVKAIVSAARRGMEPEAEIVEIVEPKEQVFIGTLKVDKNYSYLQTDSKFLAVDIMIPKKRLKGGVTGDKAVVRITDWPDDEKNPTGEVVDILGKKGDNHAEMHAILAEFELPYRYPAAVEKAASAIGAGITDDVVAKRMDMRGVPTFTIDPKDAKDFDDALSIRKLDNGNWEVGVHIADVTHYVQPGSIIDKEAEHRATSVYLVDRVVPMLPEHLSNGICSLRPDEDKLTFSCIFEITQEGKVVGQKIARTVTRSVRRFTYEEAQQVIETGKGDYAEEILTLDRLAKLFRAKRYEEGAVDFDRAEVRFDIDENGHPVGVYFKESKDANKLIEEFMLLANRTVATVIGHMGKKRKKLNGGKAFVYRVHEMPEPGKLLELSQTARTFGYKVKDSGTPREVNRSINKMLQDVKGKGEENLLATLAVRSMAKAVYSTENVGHYGLAFDYYTHFTSPIRRYPDMMVHRLLDRYLAGGRSVNLEKLEDECKHSSEMEQCAANAERASIKYKQVEYMGDHLGEVYEGVISGVTEWGLYVELDENKCEGLIPVRELDDDYYEYDEKNFALAGRRNNRRFRLGDKIKVRVARADLDKKQLDFVPEDATLSRRGDDRLGRNVGVRQALAEGVDNRRKRQKQRSSRRR